MNRIFRIIWSKALRTWVVASELAMRRGKGGGVDQRTALPILALDRDRVEGSPPATAWPLRVGILLALLSVYAPAEAANRFWDFNGTGVGRGGTGTWDTTSPFWSPNADGVSGPYSAWNNAALDDAFFGGTFGTVTLGTPISVHNLTFETNGYVITGNTLTLGGVTPTITTNAGVGATISSIIAGSAGLTKSGTGTLTLNGVNTFTGNVNVTSGTLSLNGDAALGAAGNGVTLAGGTGFASSGALNAGRIVTLSGGTAVLSGAGVGSARYTGAGGLNTNVTVTLNNDANDYTGQTLFASGSGAHAFTSIANLGVASSLGAPTAVADGTIAVSSGGSFTFANYIGDGDSSNRNWSFGGNTGLQNIGTGTLTLTGDMATVGAAFIAQTADLALLGVISGTGTQQFLGGGVARTITLGTANTYSGATTINNLTVRAGPLANAGAVSSLGTGSSITLNGNAALSYTGAGSSSDRTWSLNGANTLRNDGSGALALSGAMTFSPAVPADSLTLGGSFTGVNTLSGVISGAGGVISSGSGTWVLGGANTYTGTTTVNSGTLRAGIAQAFGASTNAAVVNGGSLDLNGFNTAVSSLSGTGGAVALGAGTLTIDSQTGTTSYLGNIIGSGGLTKMGASTQTLAGTNTYTGATTIGGGTLHLDFGAATAPTSNILSSASTLNMGGGTLAAVGAAGEANTQTFNGVNVTGGSNSISATSGAGGSMTLNLGAITRTGGLIDFNLPTSGNITTTNTVLGGWATVANGTNYAKVVGGNITAFTNADYSNKDNAANWLNNEFITDTAGFFGTVAGTVQLGGLRYSAPAATTVTVASGQTLGVDGSILVAPTVGANTQTITGGSLTGTSGGGVLGFQQNSTGNFIVASTIVDNGGSIGLTKAGTGLLTLTNNANSYTGATRVLDGILSVANIGNGGVTSGIGASSAASSNLALVGGTLRYTGGTATTDRGFTLINASPSRTFDVSTAATNLTFTGLVTSPDGAGFIKSGLGTLTLANGANDYIGATTVTGGTLAVNTLANGGLVSGIGASSSAASNLVLSGGTLNYTGGSTSTDRGFTVGVIGLGGSTGGIGVDNAATTLTMSGTVIGDEVFHKDGAGTLVLSGINTHSGGTLVNAGTLRAGSTQAFGNAAATLNVAAGATADLNNFNTSIGALLGAGSVTLGSATLTSAAGSGTFTGTISGTGGFTRGGGFTVAQIMTDCSNTYTGATSIVSGILTVDCLANGGLASGIGASTSASSNLVFNTGILRYTGGSVSIDRGFTTSIGLGAIEVTNAATTLGFSGTVAGTGLVRKDGPGTLVLSGNNTYSGNTQVIGGTLRAGSATAFGTGGMTLDNTAGVALDVSGSSTSVAWLAGGGTTGGNINLGAQTLTISSGANTYAGSISGTGNLIKNGGGTQTLAGCNSSYTGTTTINGGALEVDCLANGGTNSSIGANTSAASNLVLNGGTLRYTGAGASSDRLFTLGTTGGVLDSSGTGALQLTDIGAIALTGTNATRTLFLFGTNTDNNTLAAQLTDNGTGATSLNKSGTGTWILTNNSSNYTGVTTISGGVLGVSQLADGGMASGIGASSGAASNLIIGNGATLRYTGAGDSTNRLFTLGTGVAFIESSGTGAINFSNTGAVTLSGTNTARTIALGGTNTGDNIMGGAIGDNGTGQTTLAKNDGGNWILTGNNTYTGNTVINDGNLTIGNGGTSGNLGTGSVNVTSATSTLSINRSDTVVFNTTMSGPGAFAQIGTGTTTLTANSTIGAVRVSAGTLDVNGVLNSSTIAMTGTSTLNVDGTMQAAGGAVAAITGDLGASTINVNGGAILRANGDLGDGSDALTVTGTLDTGAAVLNLGAGSDTLTINDGVITGAGVDAGAGINDSLVINNALARTFGGFSGFETLTKQNTGTLTLTGSQSYSAGTTISGGSLDVDGTMETSAVTMAGGTTLNVDGTVQGMGGTAATLTGSAGSETIVVNAGATLRANGDLGDGTDNLTLAGTLDTGPAALSLGAGDEIVTLRDGIAISGAGLDGGVGNDQLVLDNALEMIVGGSALAGFERLLKQNSGTADLFGSHNYGTGTEILGGSLRVVGALETPLVTLVNGTQLNVLGSLQAVAGTAAIIIGDAGENVVSVGTGGNVLANGDLGAGNDVLDVHGTLDTGGGTFMLGDGDDTFAVYDGTVVTGNVDGGAGNDVRVYDINTIANVGALLNFEELTKTGTGTLSINGPGATNLEEVNVLGGTLNIGAGGSVVATAGLALDTVVGSGATLNVDGSYGCGAGNDTMTVSGTVSGTGTIDLCGGDDTLTLQTGAVLSTVISGGTGTGDTLVLDTAGVLSFNAGNTANFELLQKTNTGIAILTGAQSFIGGVTIDGGILDVDGALETPSVTLGNVTALSIDGVLQGAGATAATVSGSAGSNTVAVGAGGLLLANGDLGDGGDVLDVSGTLDTVGGVFALGAGDDIFTVHDGPNIIGTIDGGAGLDTRVYDINLTADLGALVNFEGVTKTGTGTLNINGPDTTVLEEVSVLGGTLNVGPAGGIVAQTTTVASGSTLQVDGTYDGTSGADTMAVAGIVTGSGTVALNDGDDTLTLQDGADLSGLVNAIDGGTGNDTINADIAGSATLGSVDSFETLTKTNTGTLNIEGTAEFSAVNVNGGMLDIGAGASVVAIAGETLETAVVSGAILNVDGSYGCGAGDDSLTVSGTVSGTGTIDLCDGNDTLTLNDGAVLNNVVSGGTGTGDALVLNNAGGLSFDATNTANFELLQKNNTGEATLTGTQSFTGGTDINGGTLTVEGALETPTIDLADGTTLNVDGSLQAVGGTAAAVTGSAGTNTVTVGAGGSLLANGDLGTGNDVLDVSGTLDTGGGVFALGDGDDTFTVHDGTNVIGTVDGGAGLDTRIYDINLTADLGTLVNFEGVTKTGTGVLNINGPGATDLQQVDVLGGTLNIGPGGSVVAIAGSPLDTTIAAGAILNVDGSYGCGADNDTMTVSGTVSGSGTIDLCGGDDTLTLNDGAVLNNVISGGGHGTGDTVVLNNANALSLDAGTTINFEFLQKDNAGTATLTGTQSFIGGTTVNGGVLDVDGTLETPTVALADNTVLNVDGSVQAAGGAAAAITGSAGTNTVSVTGTLLAAGDLGAGNDVLDVAGTLDTMGGTFALGNGDDTLTIHDGTNIIGTVAAGAGTDTFNADIASVADLGAVQDFETLSKTGVGVLNVNGPMSSDFITVNVNAGTLNVTAAGSVTAQTTTVAAGSTLHVDGSYSGTAGNDLLDVAGTLDMGGGAFMLGDGDDNFVVHDGTVVLGTVDGGGGLDTRTYDINTSADLGALVNFEAVTKTGAGVLNINGPGATDLQQVDVLGGTLNIGPGGSVVAIVGGPLNTLVASGATLNVDGSYGCGDGNDTMTVSGTVSGSGTIDLCAGDDTLILNDGAVLATVIDGNDPTANDTVILNNANALSFDGANVINFERLQKDNTGTATLTGTQSFTGGTTINGGTLDVDGALETPTVVLADDTVLNVDGSLQAAGGTAATITGSAGANTVTVSGTLLANGDLGDGNDMLDVTGTLDTMAGTFVLGDGDDTLTIHDDTDIVGTVVAGAGNDTFNADIDTVADLGAVQDFETLSKTGDGVLNVNGPMSSDFTSVNVLGGTLDVTAGGSVMAQTTTVSAGATLQVEGSYSGTSGDDTFTSMGTVLGAFAFGDGNDTVAFIGGDPSGVTALDGGVGSDLLSFSGLDLQGDTLPALVGWERMELLNGSALDLGNPLDLSGGVLAIDGTSRLFANAGAAIGGSVENAGLISTGAGRLAIDGDYTGNDGQLEVLVSPGNGTSGGLDIVGDVISSTAIVFDSDGTAASDVEPTQIKVIDSPNDTLGNGGFVAAGTGNDDIRLEGDPFAWKLSQEADNNWYLINDASTLLPEVSGYAVLPSIGLANMEESNRLLFQRLSGVRGEEPHCERRDEDNERAYASLTGDCRGVWMAATGSELEMGADPGFEFSGDNVGMFLGVDQMFHDRGTRTFRGGVYAGYQSGNYWASGVNSSEFEGGESNVRTDTLTVGMYGSVNWNSGAYLDASWVAQLTSADVMTADGFNDHLSGNSMTASVRGGRLFALGNSWSIEPQFELKASAMQWGDIVDAAGKQVSFDDDVLGRARLGARLEKRHVTASGARVRYWTTLGLQDTFGEKDEAVSIASAGSQDPTMWLPNHKFGLAATLDVGVEAELRNNVSLFGVLSLDQDVNGSDYEQRAANLGVRVRW